jgi:ribosome biogenesis GTPase A
MKLQWYPGHMTKAKRQMQEDLKLIDLVIEVIDSRIPYSSRNPEIDQLAQNKARVILMNKADLADEKANRLWTEYFREQGAFAALADSRKKNNMKEIRSAIDQASAKKKERDRKRGILNRPVRAMIVGIPNCGKSTFINTISGKASTKTGNKPGVTKGKQWIKLNKDIELLDTPGILWPKFEDEQVGSNLALVGSIKDEIVPSEELSLELIAFLTKTYPGVLNDRYHIDESGKESDILIEIAKNRKCIKSGGEADYEKAAKLLLDEFRSGALGKLTLERP